MESKKHNISRKKVEGVKQLEINQKDTSKYQIKAGSSKEILVKKKQSGEPTEKSQKNEQRSKITQQKTVKPSAKKIEDSAAGQYLKNVGTSWEQVNSDEKSECESLNYDDEDAVIVVNDHENEEEINIEGQSNINEYEEDSSDENDQEDSVDDALFKFPKSKKFPQGEVRTREFPASGLHNLVLIEGLANQVTKQNLLNHFGGTSAIQEILLPSKPKGFAIIIFRILSAVQFAELCNGDVLMGKKLKVKTLRTCFVSTIVTYDVYVQNIPKSVQVSALKRLFERAGDITKLNFPLRENPLSKCALVGFENKESLKKALTLDGTLFHDREISVKIYEDRRFPNNTPETARISPTEVFITNLIGSTTRDEVEKFFQEAGNITCVKLPLVKGFPGGFGFVSFEDEISAQKALTMSGQCLNGQQVIVSPKRLEEWNNLGLHRLRF